MAKIIVGVDGSDHATVSLRWAARRAERRGDEVVALLAWTAVDQGHRIPDEGSVATSGDVEVQRILDSAVAAAGCTMLVTKQTAIGDAAEALTEAAGPEDLIVVGSRGLGGFKRLLLGSVSLRVLELATCPVAVIHNKSTAKLDGDVVVGIDGSEMSMRALRWAAQEALGIGATLRIVHAWQMPAYADMAVPEVLDALAEGAHDLVDQAAADPALDGVTVVREVVCDGASHALLSHEADAAMIVVASRGLGAVRRVILGSTSRQIANHAEVPVVVVASVD